jgi:hypothetical protein
MGSETKTATAVSQAGGSVTWSGISNVTLSDDVFMTTSATGLDTSDEWRGETWNFSIPAGKTITGIEVNIERKHNAALQANVTDLTVQLRKASGKVGDNKARRFMGNDLD